MKHDDNDDQLEFACFKEILGMNQETRIKRYDIVLAPPSSSSFSPSEQNEYDINSILKSAS